MKILKVKVERRTKFYMHINFLPDRILQFNHYEERSMIMTSPWLSIKIYNKFLKINKFNLISNGVQFLDFSNI